MKHADVRIIGVSEEEERKEGAKTPFKEVITENFPNLRRDLYIQVHKDNGPLHYLNAKQPSPRYIKMEISKIKDKERILIYNLYLSFS